VIHKKIGPLCLAPGGLNKSGSDGLALYAQLSRGPTLSGSDISSIMTDDAGPKIHDPVVVARLRPKVP